MNAYIFHLISSFQSVANAAQHCQVGNVGLMYQTQNHRILWEMILHCQNQSNNSDVSLFLPWWGFDTCAEYISVFLWTNTSTCCICLCFKSLKTEQRFLWTTTTKLALHETNGVWSSTGNCFGRLSNRYNNTFMHDGTVGFAGLLMTEYRNIV